MFENHLIQKSRMDAVKRRPERMSMTSKKEGAGYPDKNLPKETEMNEASPSRNPIRKDEDEKNEKKEEMEKGFLTHLKSQGLVPPKGTGAYGKHGADMHEHRSQMHASKKYTEAGKQADAGEGMRNLHKAMCPVMKGLQKLLKGLADKNNL